MLCYLTSDIEVVFIYQLLLLVFVHIQEGVLRADTKWLCLPSCAASPALLTFCSSEGSVKRYLEGGISGLSLRYGTKRPPEVGTLHLSS